METKQRLHTRPQAAVTLPATAPPFTPADIVSSVGRVPRYDFRGFPQFTGLGPEVALVPVS